MKKLVLIGLVAACLLCLVTPVAAQNTLTVTNAAAMEGTWGMQVDADGSSNLVWVRSLHPANEKSFTAKWLFRPINVIHEGNQKIMGIHHWRGTGGNILKIFYRQGEAGNKKLIVRYKDDLASQADGFGATQGINVNPAVNTLLQVDWTAASAPGANDGTLNLWKQGALVRSVTGIDNDDQDIGRVTMGLVLQTQILTGSQMYFDSYESFR